MAPADSEPSADRQRGRAVSVWLADEDVAQIKQIAQEKGIGHTTLIRMWVKERLNARASEESSESA